MGTKKYASSILQGQCFYGEFITGWAAFVMKGISYDILESKLIFSHTHLS